MVAVRAAGIDIRVQLSGLPWYTKMGWHLWLYHLNDVQVFDKKLFHASVAKGCESLITGMLGAWVFAASKRI